MRNALLTNGGNAEQRRDVTWEVHLVFPGDASTRPWSSEISERKIAEELRVDLESRYDDGTIAVLVKVTTVTEAVQ